jgi:DNA/RNA-binding domain of Phe-tRNA-synthetase-like protein
MHKLGIDQTFRAAYPEASIGILGLENVTNCESDARLDDRKAALEAQLCARFKGLARADLQQIEPMRSYISYYKRFRKSYHVLLQLESIVSGSRTIPHANGLVEAMFMAELKNQVLTAGHDAAVLRPPLRASVATGSETFVTMSGRSQALARGDMFVEDAEGVLSAVLHGPDARTKIETTTTAALYVVYAPQGVTRMAIVAHLDDIRENVSLFSPGVEVTRLEVLG